MTSALSGIRVLDFGRYIAGPWCAALLGDFGADVIRIDKIGGGEDRHVLPFDAGRDGAMYQQMNRNKRCMALASSGSERDDILKRLVESADVVVVNMPDTALAALGLSYEQLVEIKPDIILTTATAFGHEGPFAGKVGFDVVAQAMSGAMHLTGHEGEPMRSGVAWVDFNTAALCAFGTMVALMERKSSGRGQHVRGSLLATAMTASSPYLIEQAMTGVDRSGLGNLSQLSAPADTFRTKDGHIVIQVVGNPMFRRWARLVGAEELIDDSRFGSDESRAEHGRYLSDIMQTWCSTRTVAEALTELEAARLPAGPVLAPQQSLDHPHMAEGKLLSTDHPGHDGDPIPVANTPVWLSRTPGSIHDGAPGYGSHTDQILEELGYSKPECLELRDAGVVE